MPRGLKIGHLNVRGILKKLDELRTIIYMNNFKILFISESFLKPDIPSELLTISDFYLIRRDRISKHGGGVIVYIHKSVPFHHLSMLQTLLPETICLKITNPSAKPFILSVTYRPPNTTQG